MIAGKGKADFDLVGGLPLGVLMADEAEIRKRIGRHLRGIREQREISQEEAAVAIGISRPHLSNVERGRARATWDGLHTMAEFYTQDIKELIEECRAPGYKLGSVEKRTAVRPEPQPRNGFVKEPTTPGLSRIERFLVTGFRMLAFDERQEIMALMQKHLGIDNGQD